MTSPDCSHMEGSARRLALYLMGLSSAGSQISSGAEEQLKRTVYSRMERYCMHSFFRINRYRTPFMKVDTKECIKS